MIENFDSLFEQLLTAIQTAEKRHRTVRDSASDNSDWITLDAEVANILKITKWRQNLESLRTEIMASELICDDDVPVKQILNGAVSKTLDIAKQSVTPSQSDEKQVGRYVWQKMKDLSNTGFTFTDEDIANLQNVQWCERELNLPYQFFYKTTEVARYHSEGDIIVFNNMSFRLCTFWYKDSYRGRSQRECFDNWFNKLCMKNSDISIVRLHGQDVETLQESEPIQNTDTKQAQTKFTLLGKEYQVSDWNNIYIKTCEVMLLHRPYIVAALDKDNEFNTDSRTNFNYVQSEIKNCGKRLSNGLWIETNQDSSSILTECRRVIEKCGFSPDELKVETVEAV